MPKGSKAKTKLARSEIAAAIIVLVLSVGGLIYSQRGDSPSVSVGDRSFDVQVVDDPAERAKGLSGQSALDNDEGMLFIMERPDRHGIWMKDMLFSIDILWIDENFRVVHIEEMVSPNTYPETFRPNVDSLYVLEVYTGQVAAQGLRLGDEVIFDI